jgi:hypothetical protein
MRKNLKRWEVEGDFEVLTFTREINIDYRKRMNKSRYKRMMHLARYLNYHCEFRYGMSRNGYAYRCGCEHDCCGCISQSGYRLTFLENPNRIQVVYFEAYNY